MILTTKQAEAVIGGRLSKPSKMPGAGFGLPATLCKTGSYLRKIPNSACSKCYALKGRYSFRKVSEAQHKRFNKLNDPQWVDAVVVLITASKTEWFRWHDSGDIQDTEHLERIVEVAVRMPQVNFWLPTREKGIVRAYNAQYGDFPANLTVRVSAAMIEGAAPVGFCNTSTISKTKANCPAPKQGNQCGDCRRCWDKSVKNVSYKLH